MTVSLKEHNNIVQNLLKDLNQREKELKQLHNTLHKLNSTPQQNTQPVCNQRPPAQIKELQTKNTALQAQLTAKNNEIKELNDRLCKLTLQQQKHKDHVAELAKKTADRKPSSREDYKVSALIQHYEAQMDAKKSLIQRQAKEIEELKQKPQQQEPFSIPVVPSRQLIDTLSTASVSTAAIDKYIEQVGKLQHQLNKAKEHNQALLKQINSWKQKYSDLTKDYYLIANQAPQGDKKDKKGIERHKQSSSHAFAPFKSNIPTATSMNSLLWQVPEGDDKAEQSSASIGPLSPRIDRIDQPPALKWPEESKLKALLNIVTGSQISQVVDTMKRTLDSIAEWLGLGCLEMTELSSKENLIRRTCQRLVASTELLEELCIVVGVREPQITAKVKDLLSLQQQYISDMRQIKHVRDLHKGNKIQQFIDFFRLDTNDLALPQQMQSLFEQLKQLRRFIVQAGRIMNHQVDLVEVEKFLELAVTRGVTLHKPKVSVQKLA